MPELPEVETIRLGLEKYLIGHTIRDVEIRFPKIVQGNPEHIKGATVTGIRRFGKGLVIDLNNHYCIAVHIKLTGQLIFVNDKTPEKVKVIRGTYSTLPAKSTHVIFHLDKNGKLYYNDFRRFGWIKIVQSEKLKDESFFRDLGPEFIPSPDSGQIKMTEEMFETLLSKSRLAIKVLLMDQKKISGIGNIYANDALNLSKIDPRRKAKSLSKKEARKLYDSILQVLKEGIKYGGASELSYVNALGQEGSYQEHFIAYGRDGKPCKNCGHALKKIVVGGRGTYFCPNCQK